MPDPDSPSRELECEVISKTRGSLEVIWTVGFYLRSPMVSKERLLLNTSWISSAWSMMLPCSLMEKEAFQRVKEIVGEGRQSTPQDHGLGKGGASPP